MTVALVHGFPETSAIWRLLQRCLDGDSVAIALPGLGTPRPAGFTATKDAFAGWLAEALARLDPPVDLVGHDIGALLTLRLASAFDLPLRSFVVDVANVFHPEFVWPDRVHSLQTPGLGEELLQTTRTADPNDPRSTTARLAAGGVPHDLAAEIATAHDQTMSQCILDFYRSAAPNIAADWWTDASPTSARGLVLLLPDPPDDEAMALDVASRLGAQTERLEDLNHCWMAEAPNQVAAVLQRFWSSRSPFGAGARSSGRG
jgi:pimeloyl-ACP methyl ester carboxylesterase